MTSDIPSCSKVPPSGAGSGVVTQARLILSGPPLQVVGGRVLQEG